MTDNRVTDGHRIAELLVAELDGRTDGGLNRVGVVQSTRDPDPSADDSPAFTVTVDGEPVASVTVQPNAVRLGFTTNGPAATRAARDACLPTQPPSVTAETASVVVNHGAAVKAAVDVIRTTIP